MFNPFFCKGRKKKPVQKTNLDVKGPMTPKSHNGQICFTFAVIKSDSKEIRECIFQQELQVVGTSKIKANFSSS